MNCNIILIAFASLCCAVTKAKTNSLFSSSSDSLANHEEYLKCFNNYVKNINAISATYNSDLSKCTETSQQNEIAAEVAATEPKDDLTNKMNIFCTVLEQCQQPSLTIENSLQCYITEGLNGANVLLDILTTANQQLMEFEEILRQLIGQKIDCAQQASDKYMQNVAMAYLELNNCFLQKSGVPTIPPFLGF
ncbi:uncharacterized protein LOC101891738 [Musca domestica]|uniref:Uncharacterized protein LOC101891738 n=1 Tax=Musca domestica TaxID=7370 RepID=A0A9J7CIN0_MUSDO|nr:uncharacterized protein LOC101891738 [Musca domestica]